MFEQIESGFGAFNGEYGRRDIEELAKAMTAGYGYASAPGSLTGGSSLMVESLEYTLHSVTWDEKALKLWPVIPKVDVWNTVHEYERYTSHGAQYAGGGFFDADAQVLPVEVDAEFNRQYAKVRYLGCTKAVTHPMTLVRTMVESAVAIQARAGTKWILEQQERQLAFAHDNFLDPVTGAYTGAEASLPSNTLKYDGIGYQITKGDTDVKAQYTGWDGYGGVPSSIYDFEAAPITEEDLESMSKIILDNHGMPTHFFMDHKTHSDLNKVFQPKERINTMGVANGQAGFVLTSYYSSAGIYQLVGSRFLSPKRAPLAAQTGAPATPSLALADAGVTAGSNLVTGTYSYRVAAVNNIGESAACAQVAQALGTDGRAVQLTITAGGGDSTSNHYAIYRAPIGETTGHEFIGYVYATAGIATGAVCLDKGVRGPGLATGYLLQFTPDEIVWHQLAPLMKMNLAVVAPAIRFMVLLYGMPIVYKPKHHVLGRNIGRQAG